MAAKPSPKTRKLVFDPPRGEGKGAARAVHTSSSPQPKKKIMAVPFGFLQQAGTANMSRPQVHFGDSCLLEGVRDSYQYYTPILKRAKRNMSGLGRCEKIIFHLCESRADVRMTSA